jgi:hypothetical protein
MNLRFVVSALVVASAFVGAIPGCAVDSSTDAGEEGDAEESAASQDELTSNATRLVGAYHGEDSLRPPTFTGLVFEQNGEFFADVDSGIRCIKAPCPSNTRLVGRFSATKNYLRLDPKAGEQANTYHGRYRYTLENGQLSLTRAGTLWKNWSNNLEKGNSYCSAPTDCDGQSIIHPMCAGHWSCGVPSGGKGRSCGWDCGVPANDIWPADKQHLVAETAGGGFTPPPPPGSNCTIGRQKYTLDVETRELTWEMCGWNNGQALKLETGSRVITTAELATVDAAMDEVSVSTRHACGADKPLMSMKVTSASQGTKTYTDSFYSCGAGDRTYVDNIDGVFSALRALSLD